MTDPIHLYNERAETWCSVQVHRWTLVTHDPDRATCEHCLERKVKASTSLLTFTDADGITHPIDSLRLDGRPPPTCTATLHHADGTTSVLHDAPLILDDEGFVLGVEVER